MSAGHLAERGQRQSHELHPETGAHKAESELKLELDGIAEWRQSKLQADMCERATPH